MPSVSKIFGASQVLWSQVSQPQFLPDQGRFASNLSGRRVLLVTGSNEKHWKHSQSVLSEKPDYRLLPRFQLHCWKARSDHEWGGKWLRNHSIGIFLDILPDHRVHHASRLLFQHGGCANWSESFQWYLARKDAWAFLPFAVPWLWPVSDHLPMVCLFLLIQRTLWGKDGILDWSKILIRIWDMFFLKGSKILFRFSLAILHLLQKDLMAATEFRKSFYANDY